MSDFSSFFNSMPLFSRYWFSLSIIFSLAARFGLLNGAYLVLDYYAIIHRFQIWRLVTSVFYFPLGPNTAIAFLLNLYFIYNYSIRLETGIFANRPAEYFFMLLFNWVCSILTGFMFSMWLLMDPMILSVLYVWCQFNKDNVINFWFGSQFKAIYLPWVLMGFNFLIRGSATGELAGIIIGHLYYFLMYSYPLEHNGTHLLQTPQVLYDYFPSPRSVRPPGFVQPVQRPAAAAAPGRHTWGRGHVLGD